MEHHILDKMWWFSVVVVMVGVHQSSQDLVTLAPSSESSSESTTFTSTAPREKPNIKPTIRSLQVTSNIKYRYATTLVSSRVVNPSNISGEASFTVTLPESAFISEFLMEVKGKVYKAYVKEKKEAKADYDQAVQFGQAAGHVALDARDSNEFTVSVNIEAQDKVTFNLTYEQLLSRILGTYSNVININPQQIVQDMSIKVYIEEPTEIKDVEVPEIQTSNEALPEKFQKNSIAKIETKSPNHTEVTWAPTAEEQKAQNSSGVSGQFIVRYDVDRSDSPQQILVDEGYFVHFFAPEDLPRLAKHVVFVLDFSGSMAGRKLEQLLDAMKKILSELNSKDFFSIVVFQTYIEAWSPNKRYYAGRNYLMPWEREHSQVQDENSTLTKEFIVNVTPENIEAAKNYLTNYTDLGGTNIIGGLRTGLEVVEVGSKQWENESNPPTPVMVFLTDGEPNIEESDPDKIIAKTKLLNSQKCPVFSLAFGYGADSKFLRKLSLSNFGFARNIYEASDASDQLNKFYQTISSPLLSNVTFSYLPGQVDNSTHTKSEFPVFFEGSELVVSGKVRDVPKCLPGSAPVPIGELKGHSASGYQMFPITIFCLPEPVNHSSASHLEKTWAYLTIQQLLDKADSLDDSELKNYTKKEALDLALQYSFVTPLTSMVVVKPNETESSVDATKVQPGSVANQFTYGGGGVSFASALPAAAFSSGGMAGPPPYLMMAAPIFPGRYLGDTSNMFSMHSSYSGNSDEEVHADSVFVDGQYSGMGRGLRFHLVLNPMMYQRRIIPPPGPVPQSLSVTKSIRHYNSRRPISALPSNFNSGAIMTTTAAVPEGADLNSEISYVKVAVGNIKWLQPVIANFSETENVPVTIQGQEYILGLNETDQSFGACQVNKVAGECHHFKFCPLNIFQEEDSQFLPYQCPITGNFLGVCCPQQID